MIKRWFALITCLALPVATLAATDTNDYRWQLRTSVYTTHFDHDPEHNNRSRLLGLDYYPKSRPGWLVGGSTFRNSWDQQSVYIYGGRRYEWIPGHLYGKLTAGVLYGWRGEHQDAILLNQLGVAPAIIPAIELRAGRFTGEFVVFGINGLMVNMGMFF